MRRNISYTVDLENFLARSLRSKRKGRESYELEPFLIINLSYRYKIGDYDRRQFSSITLMNQKTEESITIREDTNRLFQHLKDNIFNLDHQCDPKVGDTIELPLHKDLALQWCFYIYHLPKPYVKKQFRLF